MKALFICGLVIISSQALAGRTTAQSVFQFNDVVITSPLKVEFSINQRNPLDANLPTVKNIYVEVVARSATVTTTKGKPSATSGALTSIRHAISGNGTTWMQHTFLDFGASHSSVLLMGKSLTLESSDLAGKAITLKLVEEYSSGKKVVSSSVDLDMPAMQEDLLPPEIEAGNYLRGFITSGTLANGYTISTRPGSFIKDDVGVKYAEIYINGQLRGTSSFSQQIANQTYILGDAELKSHFHMYNTVEGEGYYFQQLPVFFVAETTTVLIRAYDFAGNMSEKTIILQPR